MKKGALFIAMALCLMVATGCAAPKPYVSDPESSHALNVLRAAGARYIKDVKAEDFEKQKVEGVKRGGPAIPAMITLLGGGFLPALSYWSVHDDAPEATSFVFAWMPEDMAENGKEANDKLRRIVAKAFARALTGENAVELPSWFEVGEIEEYFVEITGKGCDGPKIGCQYSISTRKKPGKKGFSPDFLGGSPAWIFTFEDKNAPLLYFYSNKRDFPTISPDYQVYLEASKYLPEWVFLYLAPGKHGYVSVRTENDFEMLNYPVVFNQGESYFFVKPD
ncbi:hypothetical protein [Geoalkalibacter subterraneus]|uniref:Lipoprotein n=1 Tax=Geoalkalibacter subterraneus TaxID=483547 RepID=A0A0B5FTY1_9BACT|nr:hypothetical protein [Geoalkalibacter subterraneus]AJF08139.1 hypothetical protein GSUB_16660 [Geoalkalibacter subterraneus]